MTSCRWSGRRVDVSPCQTLVTYNPTVVIRHACNKRTPRTKILLRNYIKSTITMSPTPDKTAPIRVRGENVGSPLKGWAPMDPTTAKLGWYFKEIMLGLVICFTQTPETIGFALSAHIDPSQGLHSAWILGTMLGIFGGRPGMITGFSGASTSAFRFFLTLPGDGKSTGEGIEYIYPSVILTGCLMFLFGMLRLGERTMNILGSSVMIGFCCGLAITICKSQFHFYEEKICTYNDVAGKKLCHREFIRGTEAIWMAVITVVVMIIKEFFPLLGRRWSTFRFIPSPLVGILVAIFIEYVIVRPSGSRTPTIADVGPFIKETAFPKPFWMQTLFYDESKLILDEQGWGKIFYQGILLFFIGTIETLMVIEIMNGFTATVGNNNQHISVLGLANVLSGTLGGAGGDAMIGMTILNGMNGAEGRVSSVSCGLGIMILIMAAYPMLNYIPVAAIGGIMFIVCIHIFKWYSIDMLICAFVPAKLRVRLHLPSRKVNRGDVLIICSVVVLTYFYNQFYGVLTGVGLNYIIFIMQVQTTGGTWAYIWQGLNKPIEVDRSVNESGNHVQYVVRGPLFFKSFRQFVRLFDYDNDPADVTIIMEDGILYDYSSLDGLNKVCKEYKNLAKSVKIMNLTEKSKREIRKADGSRNYGCFPFTFQWMLGAIEIAPEAEDVDQSHMGESSKCTAAPPLTDNFVSQSEIEKTPAAFAVDEISYTPNLPIRN